MVGDAHGLAHADDLAGVVEKFAAGDFGARLHLRLWDEIKKLADNMLKNPQLIEVARRNTVSEIITHRVHMVAADKKRYLLLHLLLQSPDMQVLVFVGTKFGTARLATWLERQGVKAVAIHGDKSQQQRTEALEAFKTGTARVMVATDVAARGLDIDDLPHVINYELPHVAEDYIHRIGRTGRAGKLGVAVTIVSRADVRSMSWYPQSLAQLAPYLRQHPGGG